MEDTADAARASVPDSGDAEADEEARCAAVDAAVGPLNHPLADTDPFVEWVFEALGNDEMAEDEADTANATGMEVEGGIGRSDEA